ncbi:MAG TPA: FIST N-terminal domain-containing protein, partial [Ktedonobacteraceae bacterium]|nr:FIST N-terminal domain-containing protein [Ktedonobacteraceae bacterium]
MDKHMPAARAAIVADEQWECALQQALASTAGLPTTDVAILFASSFYSEHFSAMLARLQQATGAPIILGCSGEAIIGQGLELENVPALSLLLLSLPGAILRPVRFTQAMIDVCETPLSWRARLDVQLNDVNAWLLFADPFRMEIEHLLDGLASAYGECPVLGGMASSSNQNARRTHVFLNTEVFTEGGVGLAIGGPYTL